MACAHLQSQLVVVCAHLQSQLIVVCAHPRSLAVTVVTPRLFRGLATTYCRVAPGLRLKSLVGQFSPHKHTMLSYAKLWCRDERRKVPPALYCVDLHRHDWRTAII